MTQQKRARKPPTVVTQAMVTKLVKDYTVRGLSIANCAVRAGISYSTAREWLIDAGVEMRQTGRYPATSPEMAKRIVKTYKAGRTYLQTAAYLKVSVNAVRKAVARAGAARPPGRPCV